MNATNALTQETLAGSNLSADATPIGYSKEGLNRKCEEQNDFHWLGERRGGDSSNHTPRLTSRSARGSRFVLHTSGSSLVRSTLSFTVRAGTGWVRLNSIKIH